MKYSILLEVVVNADPADLGGAARKGFNAIADKFNSGKPIEVYLLPQDGSDEAELGKAVLASCFKASSTPRQV